MVAIGRPQRQQQVEFLLRPYRSLREVASSAHPFVTSAVTSVVRMSGGGRLVPIPHGPPGVAPALEVHGQRHRDLRHLRPIARLQPQADGPMTAHPPPTADSPVQHLLIQRMAKPVPPTHGAIRPRRQPPIFDELPLAAPALHSAPRWRRAAGAARPPRSPP